ncbi:hypothetical protein SAMN06269185_1830 [Natronoarchaeum philippinense]|uniref:DUF8054 domain-containing protein n=1 Tax=Natronoarchaeum philippinense TaxID=558529 RepID=A0A285NU99_NATPI|nr:hypothetical protein [Natronoarchaeum philippinense]SNZ12607.1 hypothetical protein SAMN06269185_1830 [Natronoarchaeum philippinense]
MRLPQGQLVRSRVVSTPGTALASVLDLELTGYAVFEPQDSLLLDADGRGVLTFESGVPVLAYHTGTDRGGVEALADLSVPGPYNVDVFRTPPDEMAEINDTPDLAVPPGMPAERVAGDPRLADRTRERARAADAELVLEPGALPSADEAGCADAVTTFLDDDEKIEAIREQAREEAERRAEEWGLDGELVAADDD